jgi:hypothetical protein
MHYMPSDTVTTDESEIPFKRRGSYNGYIWWYTVLVAYDLLRNLKWLNATSLYFFPVISFLPAFKNPNKLLKSVILINKWVPCSWVQYYTEH